MWLTNAFTAARQLALAFVARAAMPTYQRPNEANISGIAQNTKQTPWQGVTPDLAARNYLHNEWQKARNRMDMRGANRLAKEHRELVNRILGKGVSFDPR